MKKNYWFISMASAIMLPTPVWADVMPFSEQAAIKLPAPQNLKFNPEQYVGKTLVIDGKNINYRAYENIVYIKNPVDTRYQRMNVYIPEAYFSSQSVNGYTAQTAPIFLPNSVGGYMPSEPKAIGMSRDGKSLNALAIALSRGYIVAAPGARGRTTKDANGVYTGKAPAVIVDLKAAVRYLRANDNVMAGDAEKIISNGTSAGGAMSALLGASGNSVDYESYLNALGAAKARDDVFAVSAYCPIANLENADAAYEWQFNGVNAYKKMTLPTMIDFNAERKEVIGTLSDTEINLSNELKHLFPTYLNSLKLRDVQGASLTLDSEGNGSFKDAMKAKLIESAQAALDKGTDLSALSWLTVRNRKVIDIDFSQYVAHITRLKTPPAFDALDLSTGENDLFGTEKIQAQHFTAYAQAHDGSERGTALADASIIKRMNPMNYIDSSKNTIASHWRIRHGTADRDTSLAVSMMLATRLQNVGKDVDYALPWGVPHSGDYDLDALFDWSDALVKAK